jgi:threonine synthase
VSPIAWRGVIEAYRGLLPPVARAVTLAEGGTPLVPSPSLERRLGRPAWLKLEGCNPTASFKDRGMTVAVSVAAGAGARGVICASTGNTAASAAAYAARAGLPCWIVLPAGAVARGKLVQAAAHGAHVVAVDAGFETALDLARRASSDDCALVNSLNPMRLEGQATVAYELCDGLGRAPAAVVLPVGNGGNITACWMGFRRYRDAGRTDSLPRLIGVQAEGANPLVRGVPVERPQTVASAIRIGRPASWAGAVEAATQSGGRFVQVSDEEILAAWRALAAEGVFVEPASAAAFAGAGQLDPAVLPPGDVVCVMTGHGLKDPDAVPAPEPERVPATADAVRQVMAAGRGAQWR